MDAQLDHSPSLTWRSILWGKELLVEGLRWKVGDGNSIHYITDPWIPSGIPFKPVAPLSHDENACVSLFITSERKWDIGLLNQYFTPSDVNKVRQL